MSQAAIDAALIREQLKEQGFTIDSFCTNPKDYKRNSNWIVTLTRNGRSIKTTFFKGSGLRRWNSTQSIGKNPYTGDVIRRGETIPSTSRPISPWWENMLEQYSEPIPPKL